MLAANWEVVPDSVVLELPLELAVPELLLDEVFPDEELFGVWLD